MENPHANHRSRVRKKYRKSGLDSFAEHEVLELLLYYCYPRRDTNEIAHRMLKEFGSLHNLFESDVETLMETLNCSENIAVFLNLIPEISSRYFLSRWGENVILDNTKIAGEYAISLFAGKTVEHFYVLCLDNKYKLIQAVQISKGTPDQSAVYPRDIFNAAFKTKATAIILAHNHPSGNLRPTHSDLETTRRIFESSDIIGIDVIDHIIVAGDAYYSFASRKQHVHGYL